MSDSTQSSDPADHEWGRAVSDGQTPTSGDIVINNDLGIAPEPLVGTGASSPLADDESDSPIPPCPLWAMKDRRHVQWHLLASAERHERFRLVFGDGDERVFAIDDGRHHAMVGRRIGASPAGVEYCLIGRVTKDSVDQLGDASVAIADAFASASELMVCGVVVEESIESSNILDIERYDSIEDVPPAYLPGEGYHAFSGDLEITAY